MVIMAGQNCVIGSPGCWARTSTKQRAAERAWRPAVVAIGWRRSSSSAAGVAMTGTVGQMPTSSEPLATAWYDSLEFQGL
jgi:hypothetical protein